MKKYYYCNLLYSSRLIVGTSLDVLRNNAILIISSEGDLTDVAAEAAEDYYDNFRDFESTWPATFRIWDEEGVWLGDYMVEFDYEPTFNATEVTE